MSAATSSQQTGHYTRRGLPCLLALLALALASCSPNPPPQTAIPQNGGGSGPPAAVFAAGATVYSHNCQTCHGTNGRGTLGPALAGNRNLANGEYVAARILRGGGGMPPFHDRLSAGQIAAVASYIRSSWGNGFGVTEPEQVAVQWWPGAGAPAALFDRVCARCHGADGGGFIGPAFRANDSLRSEAYVVAKILHGGGGMPAFSGLLSETQVAALAGYIRTSWGNSYGPVNVGAVRQQSAAPEGDGPMTGGATDPRRLTGAALGDGAAIYEANCQVCHGARGGGGVAPALAGNPALQRLRYVIARIVMGGGGMVPFNEKLSSAEIAAVATHIRTSWGNAFGAVSLAQVQDEHAAGAQRGAGAGSTGGSQAGAAQTGRTGGAPGQPTGSLEIRVAPDGASITITGPNRYLQHLPGNGRQRLAALPPGTYAVSATKEGYQAASETVDVAPGQTAKVSLELSPLQ